MQPAAGTSRELHFFHETRFILLLPSNEQKTRLYLCHLTWKRTKHAKMGFVGVTVQITLKDSANSVLQGRVKEIVAGSNISLEDGMHRLALGTAEDLS